MPSPLPQDATQGSVAKRVKNELASRKQNELKVSRVLDAREKNNSMSDHQDMAFHCECDDELCRETISLPTQIYEREHEQSNRFIVKHGHVHTDIERVFQKYPAYTVVKKFIGSINQVDRSSPQSRRRREENEVVFRERNDSISRLVKDAAPNPVGDLTLRFTCECSDEDCKEGIDMTIQNYERSRENNREFFVKIGHEQTDIERVVRYKSYNVVEKYNEPPTTDGKLNKT